MSYDAKCASLAADFLGDFIEDLFHAGVELGPQMCERELKSLAQTIQDAIEDFGVEFKARHQPIVQR